MSIKGEKIVLFGKCWFLSVLAIAGTFFINLDSGFATNFSDSEANLRCFTNGNTPYCKEYIAELKIKLDCINDAKKTCEQGNSKKDGGWLNEKSAQCLIKYATNTSNPLCKEVADEFVRTWDHRACSKDIYDFCDVAGSSWGEDRECLIKSITQVTKECRQHLMKEKKKVE